MSSYDDEKTNLKSIFGDNKYPNGGNFAELIDLPDFKLTENNDGTITINNVTYDMTKSDLGSIAQISEDFNNLPNGLTFVSNGQNNAPEPTSAYWVRTFNSSAYGGRKLQVAQADSSNNRYIRTYSGIWNNWDSIATGSELNSGLANKVTDNKNGTIEVNGSSITPADSNTVNAVNAELNNKVTDNKDGSITVNGATFIPADNSKVAKLSGDNNFDTVPEVDNNPLLLASSLPSDLARTGQANTFTANQTFSIAPTITDASRDKGDNQAATMADLKSVEKSAWRQLNVPSNFFRSYEGIYKINSDKKFIEICASGILISSRDIVTLFDLSPIVDNILSVDMQTNPSGSYVYSEGSLLRVSGTFDEEDMPIDYISAGRGTGFARVYYNNLQPGVI